jgi:hypothetical protein
MPDHPNPVPDAAAPPGTRPYEVQRLVLLEIASFPPPEGDELAVMAHRLREPRAEVEAAVDALVSVGLAQRDGQTVRATPPALRFDELCNVLTFVESKP